MAAWLRWIYVRLRRQFLLVFVDETHQPFSVLVDDRGDKGPPTGTKGKKVSKATKTKTD